MKMQIFGAALLMLGLSACLPQNGPFGASDRIADAPVAASDVPHADPRAVDVSASMSGLPLVAGAVIVSERYLTQRDEADNVDSPAVWHGPRSEHWLIASAKHTHRLLVHDASTGAVLRRVGEAGAAPGQFQRPNGVFVIDDLLWVVERDNRRVQVLRLPAFDPVVWFGAEGAEPLKKPYGLWVQRLKAGDYRAYVTDNYETEGGDVPPLSELGRRVRPYRVQFGGGTPQVTMEPAFGAVEGRGVLRIVESIWGDPATGNLMVADEEQQLERNVKVYGMDGRFRGRRMGAGVFHDQPEGLALYACADGRGWWFATDQGKQQNYFHVFERRSLEYVGSFSGSRTRNSDGVWLTQQSFPEFPQGAFFAVHDDGNVAAFDLGAVLGALQIAGCTAGRGGVSSAQPVGPSPATRRS